MLAIRIPAASFERFLLQGLQASLCDGLTRVASLLLNAGASLRLHAVVHDAAFATLRRCSDDLASVASVTAVVLVWDAHVLLFENTGTSILHPGWLSSLLLLRHFFVLVIASALPGSGDLVSLLLDLIGLLTPVARSTWVSALSGDSS